jgi:hypothetical protein
MTPVDLSTLTDRPDIQAIIDRYGQDTCTDLAAYLSETYGLSPLWLQSMRTNMPVHVVVQVGTLALDAYGISPLSTVMARHSHRVEKELGEMANFSLDDRSWFLKTNQLFEQDFEDVKAAFETLLPLLGVTHDELVAEGQRQMQQDFAGRYRHEQS